MATSAVYDDASQVPELVSEVQEALRIGSPSPDHFGSGTYAMCDTAACQARAPLVKVYTRGTADSPLFDETAIFEIFDALRVRSVYLTNKQSVVTIASGHSFRNPPQFNRLVDASQRDALYETEALLDHLFSHQNTAPFAAKVLIKSLVTSNPSPRYIQAVATAFKSGAYIGRAFSGRYGDIGAAVAAVLLDREARSLVLPADTTYGKIREPLLRLVHLMRAMEYTPRDNREVALSKSLSLQIGQAVYKSPTVFSFFRPDFAAEGAVEASQLVSPEAQLGVLPNVIGMLDGVSSLVFEGLNSCSGGFGTVCERNFVTPVPSRTQLGNTGYLSFVPTDFSSAESVLHELDLLLTGGRLDPHSYAVITEEYDRALTASSCPVDRTAELCGHLVPGDVLQRGEQITNADGEVLCVSYDGVAHHIGVDGREVFSTAYSTRGYESDGLHYESGGELRMEGPVHWGVSNNKWKSDSHDEDSTPAAFHTFLAGPCMLLDTDALGRLKMHGYTSFGGQATEITCEAPSTCGVPTIEYMGCYNDNTNGVRDMIQNSFITGSNDFEVVSRACGLEACRGFSYFGLQWDNECWCGNDYGSQGENSDCGDASSTSNGICADGTGRNACGGRNAVYSLTPPPPPPPPTRSAEYLAERAKTDAMLALQVAQTLVAATPAFAVTNDPATSDVSAPEVAPRTRRDNDYKALVVMYMNGGADTQNLIVPHSNCDERNGVEQYLTTRSDAALDLDQVLQIEVAPGTQLCDTMGLHPRFDTLEQLYNDGDAAFIANIGALVEPVTQEQVLNREANLPAGLYAHNLQTQGSKTLYPQETTGGTGVLGRILKAFDDQAAAASESGGETPIKGAGYSITTDRTMFRGSPTEPILLSSAEGMMTYEGTQTAAKAYNSAERTAHLEAFRRLASKKAGSIFAETYNDAMRKALVDSEHISGLLADASLTQNWDGIQGQASVGHGQDFVAQFKQVANVIASRQAFDAEVDIFYVAMCCMDHHNEMIAETDKKYNDIDIALSTFVAEMKEQGVWDQVAVQSLSEFGRTMTSNGRGTDHAWGGNHFLIGGDVKGPSDSIRGRPRVPVCKFVPSQANSNRDGIRRLLYIEPYLLYCVRTPSTVSLCLNSQSERIIFAKTNVPVGPALARLQRLDRPCADHVPAPGSAHLVLFPLYSPFAK
jgi:uncharacterized protein (DUF1501 family)